MWRLRGDVSAAERGKPLGFEYIEKKSGTSMKWLRRHIGGQGFSDSIAWVGALVGAGLLRYEFNLVSMDFSLFFTLGAGVALLSFAVGKLTGLYRSWHKPATFDELFTLLITVGIVVAPTSLVVAVYGPSWGMPRSALLIAAPLFLLMSGGIRTVRRVKARQYGGRAPARKILIYGAGWVGELVAAQLYADPNALMRPVGFLDDDLAKSSRRVLGLRVLGGILDLDKVVRSTGASVLLVAIGGADARTMQKVYQAALPLGVEVFVVPALSELMVPRSTEIPFREIGIEDLVGRVSVKIDSSGLSALLENRTVLVTGAGGSIGMELCRQILMFRPKRLVLLDHDETALQNTQLHISGQGLLDSDTIVLADIRDEEVIAHLFASEQPDVVFHAAALKHVSTLERHPREAWKTNVRGTLNVLNAARQVEVKTFVNISTDKAAEPSSVLGKSKLLAERLTAWFSSQGSGNYLSVRFGNVLGSRGSLVPTVDYLIRNNRPVTVTDPHATRYFMSVSEASQLVLQAATESHANSVYVLDMGEPVKVVDVVKRLLNLAGKPETIVYTGLRRGEKLHEVLRKPGEKSIATSHEKIERMEVESLDQRELSDLEDGFLSL